MVITNSSTVDDGCEMYVCDGCMMYVRVCGYECGMDVCMMYMDMYDGCIWMYMWMMYDVCMCYVYVMWM